jgi:hypothetical protein
MKIKFWMSAGTVGSHTEEVIPLEKLGHTPEDWADFSEEDKSDEAMTWCINNGFDFGCTEIAEDGESDDD